MIFRDAFPSKETLYFCAHKDRRFFWDSPKFGGLFLAFFQLRDSREVSARATRPVLRNKSKTPPQGGGRKRKHAEKLRIFEKNAIFPVQNEAVHEENDTYHAGRDGIRSRRIGTGDRPRRARPRVPDRGLARRPAAGGRTAHLHRVFHSSSPAGVKSLERLRDLSRREGERLRIVVVTREQHEKVARMLRPYLSERIGVALDAARGFELFGVRYVPFGVLTDRRNRALWMGNTLQFDEETIQQSTR